MGLGPEDLEIFLTTGADRVAVPETTAADAYLGARAAALTRCLDAFWKLSAAAAWGERHSRAQEAQKRLELLDEKSRAGSLPPDEAFQRARLTLEFRGAARAAPILREILVWAPGHAGASYVLGRLLLDEKDDAGIALVEAAMEQEPDSVLPGCEALFRYLKRQGRDMEAERYLERAVAHTGPCSRTGGTPVESSVLTGEGTPGVMGGLLENCRSAFGAAPRSFSLGARWHLWPAPPFWMFIHRTDAIWVLYRERSRLLRSGRVVWGALVQANDMMFRPGMADYGRAAVYSPDPWFDDQPDALARIARAVFGLKGTAPSDPGLKKLADDLTSEIERMYSLPVPDVLTGGREVKLTTILIHRRHLPRGYLTRGSFPLVVDPGTTRATLVLPSRYWGPELRYFWDMPRT